MLAGDSTGQGYRGLYDFPVHTIESVSTHYAFGMVYAWKAMKILKSLKPDLIHAQALYMTPAAWGEHKRNGTPFLMYERGGIYRPSPFNRFAKMVLKDAARVIAQTEDQKRVLRDFIKRDDIEVIPNGIEADRFGNYDKAWARDLLSLSPTKQMVLSVGRCRPEKNLAVFVKAAQLDAGKRDWILVGDGPELDKLESMADGAVKFVGAVNNHDVPKYMAAADVLVNTSLTEGFPLAVLEGMASGLPIVAPNVCGIPEIMKQWVNGLMVEVNNPELTKWAVDSILSDDAARMRMSQANRELAKQYTWENVVERLYGTRGS